jgi:hypothetical protein
MTTDLAYEEQTLWRNLQAPATSVPFIECVDNVACVTPYEGSLDVRALQEGIADIIRRHAVLQSRFPHQGAGAQRLERPVGDNPVRLVDLRDLPENDRLQHAARVANAELCEPFDIASGPLFRAALIALGERRHVLAFTAHHIVFDGASARIVWREINACLREDGGSPPAPGACYTDYVRWQRQQLTGARLARLRTFWMRKLDGVVDRRLTTGGSHHAGSTRSKHARFTICPEDSEAMRRLSRDRRVSIATTMLALLTLVVHELTDSTDVVIGVPVSCRPGDEFDNTVGLFVNAVPIRTDLSKASSFPDLLTRLWSGVLEAYQHRTFPYECLVDALGARSGHGPPPFRIVFNFGLASNLKAALPGFLATDIPAAREPPSVADVSLHVLDGGASLDCCLLYRAELFSESQIADITAHLQRLATAAAREPDTAIRQLVRS